MPTPHFRCKLLQSVVYCSKVHPPNKPKRICSSYEICSVYVGLSYFVLSVGIWSSCLILALILRSQSALHRHILKLVHNCARLLIVAAPALKQLLTKVKLYGNNDT